AKSGRQQSAMVVRETCPACGSERYTRNGRMHTGTQHHQCQGCGRQLVLDATHHVITAEPRTLVARVLRETISLHGLCRAVGVSLRWRMGFLAARCAALLDHLHVRPVASPRDGLIGRLEVEADAMGSFVQKKANTQGVWSAMDKQTRQLMAFHVGDRSHDRAKQWCAKIHTVPREQATFSTDPYAVSRGGIPGAHTKPSRSTPGKPILSNASITR